MTFNYDYIIIGSGFGGSVSALRLAEKGYRVCVVERGKRWANSDYAKTNWQLWKWLWAPNLLCSGIQQLTFLKNALVLSGSGVGGGSLVYADDTLLAINGNDTLQHAGKHGFKLVALFADRFNAVFQVGGHLIHGFGQARHFSGFGNGQPVAEFAVCKPVSS